MNMGTIQLEMNKFTSALESLQRALDIQLRVDEENHPDTANIYNNIGIAQQGLQDFTSAFESHQRALNIRVQLGDLNGGA